MQIPSSLPLPASAALQSNPVETAPQRTGNQEPASALETRQGVGSAADVEGSNASRNSTGKQPDPQELQKALEELNKTAGLINAGLQFTWSKSDDKVIVVRIINRDTKEIIRQIPSEEAIRVSRAIEDFRGLLVKDKA